MGITLVEVATGEYPYQSIKKMPIFKQLEEIIHGPAPSQPSAGPYTLHLVEFVNSCLTKDLAKRPKLADMMRSKFYLCYEKRDAKTYVSHFVCTCLQ